MSYSRLTLHTDFVFQLWHAQKKRPPYGDKPDEWLFWSKGYRSERAGSLSKTAAHRGTAFTACFRYPIQNFTWSEISVRRMLVAFAFYLSALLIPRRGMRTRHSVLTLRVARAIAIPRCRRRVSVGRPGPLHAVGSWKAHFSAEPFGITKTPHL
jgi:hypothetical protein